MKGSGEYFQFETIQVSPGAFSVQRSGERLSLEPKAIRVLIHLIRNRDRVVTKDELVEAVWEGAAVTDNAITRIIAQIRRELGDDSRAPRYVETVPTVGYRFVADVRVVPVEEAPPAAEPVIPDPVPAPVSAPAGRAAARMPMIAGAVLLVGGGGWWATHRTAPDSAPRKASVTQVTATEGVDARPSFSPDGKFFVYCSNKSGRFELYRRNVEGDPRTRQITGDGNQNTHPAVSPDGKWIAYHSVAKRGIWVIPIEGGEPRRVSRFGSTPAWSPDSRQIAFASVEPVSLAPFDSGGVADGLWIVALDGSALRRLSARDNPRGVHTHPAWSHDGKRVLFVVLSRDTGIYSLDVETGQFTPVVRIGVDIPRAAGTWVSRVWDPVFSPDDRRIYFSAAGSKGEYSVWEIPAPGAAPVRIHTTPSVAPTGLSLSPDGSKLLFTGMRNESQLWMVSDGSEPAPLFREEVARASLPGYSADGQWLAFAVETQGRNRDLWIMPANGGEPFSVSSEPGPKEGGMTWTPGGEFLYNYVDGTEVEFRAFDPRTRKTRSIHKRNTRGLFHPTLMPDQKTLLSSCSTPFNVCLGPVASKGQRQITFDREGAAFAYTDSSGQWIGFQVRRGDSEQSAIVRTDGTEAKTLTEGEGRFWSHSFSGDGRRVAYAAFLQGVWTLWWVDRVTGERKQLTRETAFGPFVRSPAWRPGTTQIAYERYQVRGSIFALDLR